MRNFLMIVGLLAGIAGCAASPTPSIAPDIAIDMSAAPVCASDEIAIFDSFPAARVDGCEVVEERFFRITISPEDLPINPSPWYSLRIEPQSAGLIRVAVAYTSAKHRYHPKVSFNGNDWRRLDDDAVTTIDEQNVVVEIETDGQGFFLSGQEIFTVAKHEAWIENAAGLPFLDRVVIGQSRKGRPIHMLETNDGDDDPIVLFVGRQHPPETTGAIAMTAFLETVYGDSDTARQFREGFNIVAVPLMNPDGVTAGNWRHGLGGLDLNRDWGPFTQPETQAIKQLLDQIEADGGELVLFFDFHSTWRNLVYTQIDEEPTTPPFFARDWLGAVADRVDSEAYPFTREPRPMSDRPTSKNYMYGRYGIPAFTFEVGDETDHDAIVVAARIFADEMMVQLMSSVEEADTGVQHSN